MNEEYLWDKTGSDAEIEKLENLLQAFRFQETAPPAIPAKVLPFVKKETAPRTFPLARAVAACLALTSISLGFWFLIADSKNEIAENVLQKPVFATEVANSVKQISEDDSTAESESDDKPAFTKTLFIEKKSKPKILQIKKSDLKSAKRNKISKTRNAEKTVRLTKEEKYAFEQLMLALSITSSKLKIVKEKIDGAEDQAASLK